MRTKNYAQSEKNGSEKDTLKKRGFYHTKAWRRIRVMALQRDHHLCQACLKKKVIRKATEVHHVLPLEEFPDHALDLDNLQSLCFDCHEATKVRRHVNVPPGVRILRASYFEDDE